MVLKIRHETSYQYAGPAIESHNEVRLMPLDTPDQRLVDFHVQVNPRARVFWYDHADGRVHHFAVRDPHDSLAVVTEATVETLEMHPFEGVDLEGQDLALYESPIFRSQHYDLLAPTPRVALTAGAKELACQARSECQGNAAKLLLNLNHLLWATLSYDPDATHVHTTVEEVLLDHRGVCQDYAHVMLAACRSIGIPARYVSGYLLVLAGETHLRGEHAMHAWIEALLPNGKWWALDPTNNVVVNDHYVEVHRGRDYEDVAPVRGIYTGFPARELTVRVDVVPAELTS